MSDPTPAPPSRDYEREHAEEWDRHGDETVEAMQDFTLAIFQTYLPTIVRQRVGRVTARGAGGTSGTVSLTDAPGGTVQTAAIIVGEPLLKASDVGRTARVWERITFRIQNRRVVVTDRAFFLDTLIGRASGA